MNTAVTSCSLLPRQPSERWRGIAHVGDWRAVHATGELTNAGVSERLEPKIMDLLFLFSSKPKAVIAKEDILGSLWPRVIVGEDTLARSIWKLRKALRDDPKSPRYIQTVPKRGYRLLVDARVEQDSADISIETSAIRARSHAMAARASDCYFQYTRQDNESAIALYERIIAADPGFAPAYAGLANALVQRVLRWPPGIDGVSREFKSLRDALKSGHLRSAGATQTLTHAQRLAELAVRCDPNHAESHKALGLVLSACEHFEPALACYHRAVALDKHPWGPLFNLGDNLEILGRGEEALTYFEAAYAAMTRAYDSEAVRLRPWYADIAVMIGDRYRERGDHQRADSYFRAVLEYSPLHPGAIRRLNGRPSESS